MSAPTTNIEKVHVTQTPGVCGGKPCIAGTRIRVQQIVLLTEAGESTEDLIASYPHLTLSDIHGALAYYYDHRDAIEQEIRDSRELVKQLRAELGPGPLEEMELRERQNAQIRNCLPSRRIFIDAGGAPGRMIW